MATLLVTIDTPQQSVDLEVPGDVPLGALLPVLLAACGLPSAAGNASPTQWQLALESGGPLPLNRSLIDSGVVDGVRLSLHDAATPLRTANYFAVKPTFI